MEDFAEKGTSEQKFEGDERVLPQPSKGREFRAEGTNNAKTLVLGHSWRLEKQPGGRCGWHRLNEPALPVGGEDKEVMREIAGDSGSYPGEMKPVKGF